MQLSEEGHSVVVVDKNRDALRRLHHFHGKTLVGSGFDRDILYQADANNANALAAVTSGDNTNILCARIARDNYEIKNVVARIYDPQRADIYMKLGIPTVATSLWTTQQVKRWITPSPISVEWTASSGRCTWSSASRPTPSPASPSATQFQRATSVSSVSSAAVRAASTSTTSSPRRATCSSSWSPRSV
jgi:trk system potassium uptake protein